MTNPLIKPNDPRFRQLDIRDEQGKNQFSEGASLGDATSRQDVFASSDADVSRPYLPEYAAQQHSRFGLLLSLAVAGWAAAVYGAISFTGVLTSGWISPLLGIAPAAAAWLLAHQELHAASVGAIDESNESRIRLAWWLGLTALLACGSIVGLMVYRHMNFLPNVF
jgi:hypothetical protein